MIEQSYSWMGDGLSIRSQHLADVALRDSHLGVVPDPSWSYGEIPPADRVPTVSEFLGMWFSRSPHHRRVAGALRQPYGARCVSGFGADFDAIARTQLATLPADGDLMADYLTPYGMHTTFGMIDAPPGEWPNLRRVTDLITDFIKKPLAGPFVPEPAEVRAVEGCIRYLRALVERRFAARRQGPLVTALRELAGPDGADVWLAVASIGQLLAAGVEPMTTGAGIACRALCENPDLAAAVEAGAVDPEQLAEEAMRLHPPFPHIYRWVHEPCSCLGPSLAPGTPVVVDVRAVNQDPTVVEEPTAFLPERSRNTHVTFGRGPHACLGMMSGRTQIAVALRRLIAHRPKLRVDAAGAKIRDLGYALVVDALPYTTTGTVR